MKKLLVLLFSIIILPISVYASDVYYCSDDGLVGFDVEDNFKQTAFNERKFKIKIDFENKDIFSEKLYFNLNWDKKCWYYDSQGTLYCMSNNGRAFSFNKTSSKYVYSNLWNIASQEDDIWIGHGACEKF